jgi:hypothetical protein
MGLGLEGAYGVAGAWDALHAIIAERKKDEILKQQEEERRQQFQMQWAQQEEARKFRELQFQGLEQDRRERNLDRDLAQKSTNEARAAAQQKQMEDAIRARFNFLPIGYQATARDVADAQKIGIQGLLSANKIDPKNTSTQQLWTYAGSAEAQAKAREDKMREAMANRPSFAFPVGIGPYGPTTVYRVDRHGRSIPEPLMPGPMPPGQQQTLIDTGNVLYHLDKIKELYPTIGDENIGPVMGTRIKAGLMTGKDLQGNPFPQQFADFNLQISALKNRMVKLITGAAMSREEASRILAQVPDWTNSPQVFRANLEGLTAIEQDLIGRIQQRKLAGLPTPGYEEGAPAGAGAAPGAVPGAAPGANPDPFGVHDLFPK